MINYPKKSMSARQRGQAFLLIIVFAAITAMLGIAVLTNSLMISEKMEMQNAADAAAYSVSTAEARDLNFTAYTNRAMVANEIAIGQVISFMSWATMVEKTGPTLALYLAPLIAVLHTPPITPIGKAVHTFFKTFSKVGATLAKVFRAITKPVSKGLSLINKAYSLSQRLFHVATAGLSIFILSEVLDLNDVENFSGAPPPRFSGFGFLAVAGHFLTHYADLPSISKDGSFVTGYTQSKTGADQTAGVKRFASMVNSNRDNFTANRANGWAFELRPPIFPSVGVDICVCTPEIPTPFGTIPAFKAFEFKLGLDIYLNRKGGADLRSRKGPGSKDYYAWTSVDTTSVDFTPVIRLTILNVSKSIEFPGAGAPVGVGAVQLSDKSAKFGGGGLAGPPVPNMRYRVNKNVDKVSANNYGGAPGKSWTTWAIGWPELPSPFASGKKTTRGPSQTIGDNKYIFDKSYGLPRYHDTKTGAAPISIKDKKFGFESPYLIIALTKDRDKASNQNKKPIGSVAPTEGHADDEIGVIAKSEVYFSRPTDVSYLRRSDKKTEYASGFNPYWSARLVDTSVLDRVTALAMQQEQIWLPSTGLSVVMDDFLDILSIFK